MCNFLSSAVREIVIVIRRDMSYVGVDDLEEPGIQRESSVND